MRRRLPGSALPCSLGCPGGGGTRATPCRTARSLPYAQPAPSAPCSLQPSPCHLSLQTEGTRALAESRVRARLCVAWPPGSFLLLLWLSPAWPTKPAASTPAAAGALLARDTPRRPQLQEAETCRHPPTLFLSRARQEQWMPMHSKGSAFMPHQRAGGGAGRSGGTCPELAEPLPSPCVARGCFADAVSSPVPTHSICPCNYPTQTLASCHLTGPISPTFFSLSLCERGHTA